MVEVRIKVELCRIKRLDHKEEVGGLKSEVIERKLASEKLMVFTIWRRLKTGQNQG